MNENLLCLSGPLGTTVVHIKSIIPFQSVAIGSLCYDCRHDGLLNARRMAPNGQF